MKNHKSTDIDFLAHGSWPPLLSASSKLSSPLSWIIAITSCFFLNPVGLFLTSRSKGSYITLDRVTPLFKSPIFSYLALSKSLSLCLSGLTFDLTALQCPLVSRMVRHVPKGLLHLLFMQPGPPPPSYSPGPLCHLLQENCAWSPFTVPDFSSLLYISP